MRGREGGRDGREKGEGRGGIGLVGRSEIRNGPCKVQGGEGGERESVKRNMDDTDKEIKLKRKDAQIMKGWKRKGKKKGSEKKKKKDNVMKAMRG